MGKKLDVIKKGLRFGFRELGFFFLKFLACIGGLFLSTKDVRTFTAKEGHEADFATVDLVGEMITENQAFFRSAVEKIAKNSTGAFTVAYIDAERDAALQQLLDENGIINAKWNRDFIVSTPKGKIGVAVFESAESISQYKILLRRRKLLKAGARSVIAYIMRGDVTFGEHKVYVKKVARSGFVYAAGVTEYAGLKKGMRAMDFTAANFFYSLGTVTNEIERRQKFRTFAMIRVGVDTAHRLLAQHNYYPAYALYENDQCFINEYPDLPEYPGLKYTIIKDLKMRVRNIKPWGDEQYLGDIFEVIGEEMPEKYRYMQRYTVNGICSRSGEVAPGNVFFYRPQFRDKNDKDIQNEHVRMKLIFRAAMKKSLFIFSYRKLWSFLPHAVIADPVEAHIATIADFRKRLDTRFIGITGSVGKTSTKDMLFEVFKQKYNTAKSLQNSNVQIKIGLNVQNIKEETEFFIQEIGGGRPGGASRHARMILPEAAVVTNIGTAHIGNYEDQEDLMYNKLGISEGFPGKGMLFLNGDDPLLFNADLTRIHCDVCYFAIDNKDADYYVENLVEHDGQSEFDIVHGEHRVHAVLHVMGWHNVLNAVCSCAIGHHFGIDDEQIVAGLAKFKTSGIRQNMVDVGGYKLFIDCFNASATSVETTLDTLSKYSVEKGRKKVAIIGDITGMGDKLDDINEEVAGIINDQQDAYDLLILYGDSGEDICDDLEKTDNVLLMNDRAQLTRWIEENAHRGDIILFKGSSKMKLDEIIDDVYGTNVADERYIEASMCAMKRKDGVEYRMFKEYVTITHVSTLLENVEIKDVLSGRKVSKIDKKAFTKNEELKTVSLGKDILHLGARAFASCPQLHTVEHADGIRFIGKRAFANCRSLKYFHLPTSLRILESGAFRNCLSLESIHVPAGCRDIAPFAFSGCVALKKVALSEGLERIASYGFKKCRALEEVRIPSTVKTVEDFAFANCKNLKKVYASKHTVISQTAFHGCDNVEIIVE